MGLIGQIFGSLFGDGRNVVTDTVEVFRPNAEASSQRGHNLNTATLNQMAAEFADRGQRGWFDRFMDGVNRMPRPMMVMGVFGLLIWSVFDPIFAAKVFTSWALMPAGFWGVVGLIVTFYFGGRHQMKALDMQKHLASVAAAAPIVLETLSDLEDLRAESPGAAETGTDVGAGELAGKPAGNAALDEWRAGK